VAPLLQIHGPVSDGSVAFKNEAVEFCKEAPLFSYKENEEGVPEIYGSLELRDDQGTLIDAYKIRVVCIPNYPSLFPYVYETGGRIPVNIDWHVYEGDGHACICAIPEEILVCHNGITLSSFIENQVKPYFFNQKHREMHGFFVRERSHGQFGNIEFFIDIFKTSNILSIVKGLQYIKNRVEPGRTHPCFCGSGVKYRNCHREAYRLLKPLSPQILEAFIGFVMTFA